MSSSPGVAALGFSGALRDIRRARGLDVTPVADGMGLRLRAYQDFESGRVAPSLEKLRRFSDIVDCDPFALAFAALLDDRSLALACVDNKLIAVAALRVSELLGQLGTDGFSALTVAQGLAMLTREPASAGVAEEGFTFDGSVPVLTDRQRQCLQWVQAGKSSSVIGQLLGLSPRTVDDHLSDACRRLGVQTRVQAVCAAVSLNLLVL
jgi:DNA-binding CsgD family transcriptional regulator/transcriptional regulator with XRE-family HTH domain